jgi:hypothetical protein
MRKKMVLFAKVLLLLACTFLSACDTVSRAPALPETPTQNSPTVTDYSDDYLLSLVLEPELALVGENEFTFNDPTELSSQELFMLYMKFTEYAELEKNQNTEDHLFYFHAESIEKELVKFFKDYCFAISEVRGYNAEKNAIVIPTASGFAGDNFGKLSDKQQKGNQVTFTIEYFDEHYETLFEKKTYSIEFYEGGYYFLSAVITWQP